MDPLSALHRLAESGLAAFPPNALHDLASSLLDHAANTGDARWCLLSRLMDSLCEVYSEEMVLAEATEHMDRALARYVPAVASAATGREGCSWVRMLVDEINSSPTTS